MSDNDIIHNESLPTAEEPAPVLSATQHSAATPMSDMAELVPAEEMEQFIPLEESKRNIEKLIFDHYHPGE